MRVAVFIDSDFLHRLAHFDVDFRRLRELYVSDPADSVSLCFYTIEIVDDAKKSTIRPLLDWLDGHGYRIRKITVEASSPNSVMTARSQLTVSLALEIQREARRADQIYLWSVDNAMIPAIKAAQEEGARVTLITVNENVSGFLKRAPDDWQELAALRPLIEKLETKVSA